MSGKSAQKDCSLSQINSEIISPINQDTVHRICSGQVVLSLAIAMKELVENAIDAGATRIEVFLKEYGADLLEVSDNGSGVLQDNFEVLTLKHYTSKMREFSDLENVSTLGFRGEALSSLCALSDLTIITKHFSAKVATKIKYDHSGKILHQTATAREKGTTVLLEKIFSTLPVRRKEFTKNLKREFNKMCQLLYSYCLVSKGIKFNCTNVTNKGSKSIVVSTDGQKNVRDNIINIFGARQISTLIDIEMVAPNESILNEYGITLMPGEKPQFSFEFLVSSVVHGSGRSTTDRQFYFINNRPCEPSKLMKMINEVYRQFNFNQYPFVYLNIITSLLVDVNVTPDKRQVFLGKESIILATVKASLLNVFRAFPSTYKMQNLDVSKLISSERGIKRSLSESSVKKGSILETFKKRTKTESKSINNLDFSNHTTVETENILNNENIVDIEEALEKKFDICDISKTIHTENIVSGICASDDRKNLPIGNTEYIEQDLEVSLDQPKLNLSKKSITIHTSLKYIRKVLEKTNVHRGIEDIRIRFRSEIKPESNKSAKEELQKQILKSDFKDFEILGQFNLGFIISRLNNDLFIIDQHATDEKYNFEQLQASTVVDSQILLHPKPLELTHSNESLVIENLEIFRKNGFEFKIDETAPSTKKVALTAIPVSKSCVFGKDDIDEMLCMLQEFNDSKCIFRPSKVRAMFASRACRKSVKIGSYLSKSDMKRLVYHMGEIDQPWNCPHGRPTMRHLINLDLIENTN